MRKITVSLDERHVQELDALQRLGRADSRSEAVREIVDERDELLTECDDLRTERDRLQERLEAREERVDELEEQLARRSQVEEKVDVLAERVQEDDEPAPPWPIRWYRWGHDWLDRD